MSGTFPHDWTVIEDNEPNETGLLGMTDDYIVAAKQTIRERIAAEHNLDLTVDEEQGTHRQGSARIWISETEPAQPSPDVTSSDTPGDIDTGRLWFKPSTVSLYAYKAGTGWVQIILTAEQLGAIINALVAKTSLGDSDKILVLDASAGFGPKYITFQSILSQVLNSDANQIQAPGSKSAGSAVTAARADHVHPKGDADTLDGYHASVNAAASNIVVGNQAGKIDNGWLSMGQGGNIDADTLDGQHGSFYQDAGNLNAGTISVDRLPTIPGSKVVWG